ncbi:hypothetical protein DFH27DRAFT_274521 [Peziza echinospora]|nr:hypothetical protein DFH27DRAFT_274521 [Peziza echinospora]
MANQYVRATAHSESSRRNCDRSSRSTDSTSNSIPSLERHDSTCSPAESELFEHSRASNATYCTTVASFDEYEDESPSYDYYEHYDKTPRNEAIPATPAEFAQLFPSRRRFQIKHDDASIDGDMNIRVDTDVNDRGSIPKYITLFHLRMYDLHKREFSLRRYGRDCGREVAHTHQKFEKPASPKRPVLAMTKAFQSFRGKSEQEKQMTLNRQDSGYGSSQDDDEEDERPRSSHGSEETRATNTLTLEFSNYAHVELSRKGAKASRKYDFEYWGKNYSWKRIMRRNPATGEEETSYQLVNNGTASIVAVILPDPMPSLDTEDYGGEFVPACSFYLKDSVHDPINGPSDVADVIMATGLMALVDDCLKRKFSSKKTVQLSIPLPMTSNLKMNMEYVGPKRLIDEVFNRRPALQSRSMSSPIAPSTSPTRRR